MIKTFIFSAHLSLVFIYPTGLQTGKALTAKGMQVLEHVGKETMDLLIAETGIQVDNDLKEGDALLSEDQLFEEVTFDRCFYIYGGPEQLEVMCNLVVSINQCESNSELASLLIRNWRHYQVITLYYLIEEKRNSHLSRRLFMMESFKRSSIFLVQHLRMTVLQG